MKLYTKTVCPKCLWAKDSIKRNNLNVEEINIDIDEEAKQLLMSKGFMSLPVLMVDGEFYANNEVMEKLEDLA